VNANSASVKGKAGATNQAGAADQEVAVNKAAVVSKADKPGCLRSTGGGRRLPPHYLQLRAQNRVIEPNFEIKDAHVHRLVRFIPKGGEKMLGWAITFLIIALVAAVFGFGGIAAASAGIAKFLFFLFLVICVIFFIFGWRGRRMP
jgi:uncharacterized membrane protein YtjA (UPF0391 family)